MEPRPTRPPVPLCCKSCSAPLGWLSGDRRRLRLAPRVTSCHDVESHTVALRCGCGHSKLLKGGTAVFVTLDG